MSYWNGVAWAEDQPKSQPTPDRAKWPATILMILGLAAMLLPLQLAAAARTTGHISVPDGRFGGTTTATVNPGDSVVYVACFRGGERVMAAYKHTDENNQATFQLGPTPSWSGGEATCTAQEGYFAKGGRWRVLAETDFHVAA